MSIEQLGKRGIYDRVESIYVNFQILAVSIVLCSYSWAAYWVAAHTDKHLGLYWQTASFVGFMSGLLALRQFLEIGLGIWQLHRYCKEIKKVTKDDSIT